MAREITFEALNGLIAGADLSRIKTYRLDDGRVNARFYQRPVNYQDDSGVWRPIETTLENANDTLDGETYDTRSIKNSFRVRLKKNAKAPQRVDVPGMGALVVRAIGGNASLATIAGNKATYADAWDNVDWVRTVLRGRVKSDFILKNASAQNEFRFRLQGIGLTYELQPSGEVYWLKDGEFAARFAAPWVKDANGAEGMVTQTLDGDELVITVDPVWLAAAAFPVTLDPDTFYSTTKDGVVGNGGTGGAAYAGVQSAATGTYVNDSNTTFQVGQLWDGADYTVYRSFLPYDTSTLGASVSVTDVVFYFYVNDDYSTTDFNVTVVQGTQADTLTTADFDACGSTSGGSLTTSGISTAAYSTITFDATGRGFINQTGTTKLALRSSLDISATAPTGNERIFIRSTDYASDTSDPYLSITYATAWTVAASATITITPSTATKAVDKAMAATVTFTPATTKAVNKAMAAALTLSAVATVSKLMYLATSATITLVASMTKKPGKAAAATVTLAGTAVKAVGKVMAATITYTPTTTKKWAMATTAAITLTATTAKKAGKAMTATITVARQRLWGTIIKTSGSFTSRRIMMGSRTPWTETSDGGTSWTETE